MSHYEEKENEVGNELGDIVARHADWLDGPTFWELCKTAAYAYFDDLPMPGDFEQAAAKAMRAELGLD